jgi:curved DNA-binding protein CbpA
MNIYNEYEVLEKHIQLSKELDLLNHLGKRIIKEIEHKKHIRQKKSGAYVFIIEINTIYNLLSDVTNIKKFNKLRLFFCMQYYLDELLFDEIKTLESFQIEDESYRLTDLYFNQSSWNKIDNTENIEEALNITNDKFLNSDEAMLIRNYELRYKSFLDKLNIYLEHRNQTNYIRKKISRITNRINTKFSNTTELIDKIIKEDIH